MRKLFSMLLVFSIIFTAIPTTALAEETPTGEISMAGSNIRVEGNAGLRFRATVNKNEFFDKYYPTTDANKTYRYKESNNLIFGMLLIPKNLVGSGQTIVKLFESGNDKVVDVTAKKMLEQDKDTVSFTGVITSIPENSKSYSREIIAVSYMKYREDAESEWNYIYANQIINSYYNVAKAARNSTYSDTNNPSPSTAVKSIMKKLDEIIDLVDDNVGWIDGWY